MQHQHLRWLGVREQQLTVLEGQHDQFIQIHLIFEGINKENF